MKTQSGFFLIGLHAILNIIFFLFVPKGQTLKWVPYFTPWTPLSGIPTHFVIALTTANIYTGKTLDRSSQTSLKCAKSVNSTCNYSTSDGSTHHLSPRGDAEKEWTLEWEFHVPRSRLPTMLYFVPAFFGPVKLRIRRRCRSISCTVRPRRGAVYL